MANMLGQATYLTEGSEESWANFVRDMNDWFEKYKTIPVNPGMLFPEAAELLAERGLDWEDIWNSSRRLTDEAKAEPERGFSLPNRKPLPSTYKVIPWGSNPELNDILEKAAIIFGGGTGNIITDAWKLNNMAEYTQGHDKYFADNPETKGAVNTSITQMLLPGENTKQYSESGGLNYSNIIHELAHLSSKHFRYLNADGTVRQGEAKNSIKGLTGYNFGTDSSKYYDDYMRYVENDPTSSDARGNFDQRAYNFTQAWLNQTDASGQLVNRQRPELRNAIGNAMGRILADDQLFNHANGKMSGISNSAYANAPEEVYARAINTYALLKEMPEEERNKYFVKPPEKPTGEIPKYSEWQAANPGVDALEFFKIPEVIAAENYYDYRTLFTEPTGEVSDQGGKVLRNKFFSIRPETYQAIDEWMKVNKMNKTNDGFAKIELDNLVNKPLHA